MNININSINVIGILIASSLLIPSNYGLDLVGINYEDLPIIFVFLYLVLKNFKNFKFTYIDKIFFIFFFLFILYTNIFTKNFLIFNTSNLRIYFYFIFSFLLAKEIINNNKNIIHIFEPLWIVMVVNFIIVLFQIQLPGAVDGWILNNTGSNTIFLSGRLGGIQGGGPNVIGIICSIYCLQVIYKLFFNENSNPENKNLFWVFMFFITFINLILTYSRGSYIVFILGITVLIYESKKISKKIKFSLFFISGLLFLIFIYLFPSVFLKQSNRTFLSDLAIKNIEVVDGTGGGFYVKEVYRDYLITLPDQSVEESFNFTYTLEEKNKIISQEITQSSLPVYGFLKINFDYKDNLFPRTVITFYFSNDGKNWNQIGGKHTPGYIINLLKNDSYFEVGGWADGQSPGGSYLDGFVKSIYISTEENSTKVLLNEVNRDNDYFIFLPASDSFYDNRNDGKIKFNELGLKLLRPRSYWIAIPNKYDLSQKDFNIIIEVNLDEIPKGNETLFSQSSILSKNGNINNQSWKWSIIDGRMYFFWVEDVSSGYINYLGGQSLRSAKLISENYEFKTTESEFSLSQYDEITTAHNGFLTFAVEFGLLPTLLILISLVILFTKNSYRLTKVENLIFLMIITQNLTNDLIYSPDVAIYFWIFPFSYLIYSFEDYESKSP